MWWFDLDVLLLLFFFSSRRRHTRCALVTGVQTCALPISAASAPALECNSERPGRLLPALPRGKVQARRHGGSEGTPSGPPARRAAALSAHERAEIGRASCRERVCQYV